MGYFASLWLWDAPGSSKVAKTTSAARPRALYNKINGSREGRRGSSCLHAMGWVYQIAIGGTRERGIISSRLPQNPIFTGTRLTGHAFFTFRRVTGWRGTALWRAKTRFFSSPCSKYLYNITFNPLWAVGWGRVSSGAVTCVPHWASGKQVRIY